MRRKLTSRRRRQVGLAAVSVVVLGMVVIGMVLIGNTAINGITGVASSTGRATRRYQKELISRNLAETGVYMTFQWFHQMSSIQNLFTAGAPSSFAPSGSSFYGQTTATNGYNVLTFTEPGTGLTKTIRVRLYPFTNNATFYTKAYVIESIGVYDGTTTYIRAAISQRTMAFYAVLFNQWSAGVYFSYTGDIVDGPIHINGLTTGGTVSTTAKLVGIQWNSAGPQIFRDPTPEAFTTSLPMTGLNYWKTSSSTAVTPTSSADWFAVSASGQAPITNAPVVPFPNTTTVQKTAALGSLASVPTAIGVTIPNTSSVANGGIIVSGDCTDVVLTATGASYDNQVLTIRQDDTSISKTVRTTITMNPTTNQTTVLVERANIGTSSYTTYSTTNYTGCTNGVIFFSGNVGNKTAKTGGIRGVIARNTVDGSGNVTRWNQIHLCTDSGKTMRIQGSIVHQSLITNSSNANNYRSSATKATGECGVLGMTAADMPIARYDAGGTELTDVCLHAVMLATNTCQPEDYTLRTLGSFTQIGGFLVNQGLAFETSSGKGLHEYHYYDSRMVNSPPPYFPIASSNYLLGSFQTASSAIQ